MTTAKEKIEIDLALSTDDANESIRNLEQELDRLIEKAKEGADYSLNTSGMPSSNGGTVSPITAELADMKTALGALNTSTFTVITFLGDISKQVKAIADKTSGTSTEEADKEDKESETEDKEETDDSSTTAKPSSKTAKIWSTLKTAFKGFSDFFKGDKKTSSSKVDPKRTWKAFWDEVSASKIGSIGKMITKEATSAVKLITLPSRALVNLSTRLGKNLTEAITGFSNGIKGALSSIGTGMLMGIGINFATNPMALLDKLQGYGGKRLDRAAEKREALAEVDKERDQLLKNDEAVYGKGVVSHETLVALEALDVKVRDINYDFMDVTDSTAETERKLAVLNSGWDALRDTIGEWTVQLWNEVIPIFEEVQEWLNNKIPQALAFVEACIKNPADAWELLRAGAEYAGSYISDTFQYLFMDFLPKAVDVGFKAMVSALCNWDALWKGLKSWLAAFGQLFFELTVMAGAAFKAILNAAGTLAKQIWKAIKGGGLSAFNPQELFESAVEGFNDVESKPIVEGMRKKFEEWRGVDDSDRVLEWGQSESAATRRARESFEKARDKITETDDYKNALEKNQNILKRMQTFEDNKLNKRNRELTDEDKSHLRREKSQSASFESASSSWSRIASSISNRYSPEVKAVKDLESQTKKESERQQKADDKAAQAREQGLTFLERVAVGVEKLASGGVTAVLG